MEIIVGNYIGFCSGVRKAVSGTEKLLGAHGKVYCLGEIIHNPWVVRRLKDKGMVVVDDISDIPDGSKFIIRSHGLPMDQIKKARDKGLNIFDFTCPKVKRIHDLAKNLNKNLHPVIIIGNPEHAEVKAIASLIDRNVFILGSKDDFNKLRLAEELSVVVQSTFNPDKFLEISQEIVSATTKTVIYNTICKETIKRQQEATTLSKKADLIIVIGGKNSSNTKTLYDIANKNHNAFHVENEFELRDFWFKDIKKVLILSGASTPKKDVINIYNKILNLKKF